MYKYKYKTERKREPPQKDRERGRRVSACASAPKLSLCLSVSLPARARPAFSSRFSSCSARAKFSFFFSEEGAFGANFFCVCLLSLEKEERLESNFSSASPHCPKAPFRPPLAPQKLPRTLYIQNKKWPRYVSLVSVPRR
jgi:hypothetical protein